MGKAVLAALLLAVAVTLASQVSASQIGKGLGKDNMTLEEVFSREDYQSFFPNANSQFAHAQGFFDYDSFVKAASTFQEQGLFLKGGSNTQKREIAAFLAHVAHETTCGWSGSVGGPYAWGTCYKEELSPSSIYCVADPRFACVNGVSYHGRGPFPLYYNYNYGTVGNALGYDLLNYPGLVANNATVAWQTAMWYWVTPQKPNPAPHSVMVGEWTPSKEDTLAFRTEGFGLTINILNGQVECGHGDDPRADDRISTYTYFCSEKLGVDLGKNLDCGTQGMLPEGFTAVLKK